MAESSSRVALIILDGWGYRAEREGNAVALANTPHWDALWTLPSRTFLTASGLHVGLPDGQMGNSEVGHLNLGAGRVVEQDLVRISNAIESGAFFANPALVAACEVVKRSQGILHLMGVIGKGGVHAIDTHLYAMIDLAIQQGVERIAIHAMMDGRDALPTSGLEYMRELLAYAEKVGPGRVVVGTVGGRYYGMDRDRRWQRTELFYRAAVDAVGPQASDPLEVIQSSYDTGVTDEFIVPTVIVRNGLPLAPMRSGDAVICVNYRSDRMRQIVHALIDRNFSEFDVSRRPNLQVTTLTMYDKTFNVGVAFRPLSMANILTPVLSDHKRRILKTAETEKFPHVTYFFNGGVEPPYPGEDRALIPSQKVATYDLAPEMSAAGIADALCTSIDNNQHDFMLCNFANPDMVGHTGSLPAAITACETVDQCLGQVVASAKKSGVQLIITADHGNAELMIDPETGGPHTAHTTNPVPLVYFDPAGSTPPLRDGGALCDIAPTVLSLLGIPQPAEMTGTSLFTLHTPAS